MSHPQPPPDPYGQPPQPGPYGGPPPQPGPPPPPQPGYGYPQQQSAQPGYGYPQQGQPPYGQPQGPYGYPPQQPGPYDQQPYGQVPYGQVPPPPPAQGGRKTLWIVLGAVAVVVVLGIVAAVLLSGGSDGVKAYKLVMPQTILDGQYTKATGSSDGSTLPNDSDGKQLGISDATSVEAQYQKTANDKYEVAGAWGSVSDPEKSVDAMFATLDQTLKNGQSSTLRITTVQQPTKYTPSGFDGTVMKCEVKQIEGGSGAFTVKLPISICAWGDSSAVGLVEHLVKSSNALASGQGDSDASGLAEKTAKIRSEARQDR